MWAFFTHQLGSGEYHYDYLFRTCEFTDKTPQIAEEQLVRTQKHKKQSFKDTKVSVSVFSADISKSEDDGDRSTRLSVHCHFSATKTFFENRHKNLSEGFTFFPAMGSKRSETKAISNITKEETLIHRHKPIAI